MRLVYTHHFQYQKAHSLHISSHASFSESHGWVLTVRSPTSSVPFLGPCGFSLLAGSYSSLYLLRFSSFLPWPYSGTCLVFLSFLEAKGELSAFKILIVKNFKPAECRAWKVPCAVTQLQWGLTFCQSHLIYSHFSVPLFLLLTNFKAVHRNHFTCKYSKCLIHTDLTNFYVSTALLWKQQQLLRTVRNCSPCLVFPGHLKNIISSWSDLVRIHKGTQP